MLTLKLQALAAGVVLALAGVFAAAASADKAADKVAGKTAKPVVIEKNVKKAAAPVESAKPKNSQDKKKAAGGKRRGIPDDSI